MSDKRSEIREDFLGNKYLQHYNDGTKTGWSEVREDIAGNKYLKHHEQNEEYKELKRAVRVGWDFGSNLPSGDGIKAFCGVILILGLAFLFAGTWIIKITGTTDIEVASVSCPWMGDKHLTKDYGFIAQYTIVPFARSWGAMVRFAFTEGDTFQKKIEFYGRNYQTLNQYEKKRLDSICGPLPKVMGPFMPKVQYNQKK